MSLLTNSTAGGSESQMLNARINWYDGDHGKKYGQLFVKCGDKRRGKHLFSLKVCKGFFVKDEGPKEGMNVKVILELNDKGKFICSHVEPFHLSAAKSSDRVSGAKKASSVDAASTYSAGRDEKEDGIEFDVRTPDVLRDFDEVLGEFNKLLNEFKAQRYSSAKERILDRC